MLIRIQEKGLTFTFVCQTPSDIDKAPLRVSLLAVCRGDEKPFWTASVGYSYEAPESVKAGVIEKIVESIVL